MHFTVVFAILSFAYMQERSAVRSHIIYARNICGSSVLVIRKNIVGNEKLDECVTHKC